MFLAAVRSHIPGNWCRTGRFPMILAQDRRTPNVEMNSFANFTF